MMPRLISDLYRPFLFLLAMILSPLTPCHSSELSISPDERVWLDAHPIIRLGIEPSYAPYTFLNAEGHLQGVAADFLSLIERDLSLHFEIVSDLSWPELLKAVKEHRIDALATVVKLPEREHFLKFTQIYLPTPLVIMTRDETPQLTSLSQLRQLSLVLVKEYSSSIQLMDRFTDLQPDYVETALDGLRAVASGATDAYVGVLGINTFLAAQNGLNNLKVNAGFNMEDNGQRLAVRKDWPELARLLDKALDNIPTQEKSAIFQHWSPHDAAKIERLGQPGYITALFPWLLGAFGLAILSYLVSMLWNRQLKKELTRRSSELLKSESRFRRLFEHAEVSIWNEDLSAVSKRLRQLHDEGVNDLRKYLSEDPLRAVQIAGSIKVTEVNTATLRLFGATTQEQFLTRIDTTFGPDAMAVFTDELCAIWEEKEAFRSEAQFLTFDGREITCIISFYIPLKEEEFSTVPITLLDITEQKLLEHELRASKQQFDLFMLHLPYVVAIKNERYRVIYANSKSQAYLSTPADNNIFVDLGDEALREVDLLCDKAKREDKAEKILTLELNGKTYITRVLVFTIPQESGKVYVGMIYIDITQGYRDQQELKKREEIMIAQSRHAAMGEMIGMIAHQWRQPITVIAMGANNLLLDLELETTSDESIRIESRNILYQTQYLSKTIDDFRDFFRPKKDRDEVRLGAVMAEAVQVIGKSLEYSAITLSISDRNSHTIKTYSRELLQVYINLLKNAKEALIEHHAPEPKIEVTIDSDEESVITTICDNGGGLEEAIIAKVFDPYFSTKDEKTGTGLGLYMSKTIIEKHLHGTIEVSNIKDTEGRREGACLAITLPMKWPKKEIEDARLL